MDSLSSVPDTPHRARAAAGSDNGWHFYPYYSNQKFIVCHNSFCSFHRYQQASSIVEFRNSKTRHCRICLHNIHNNNSCINFLLNGTLNNSILTGSAPVPDASSPCTSMLGTPTMPSVRAPINRRLFNHKRQLSDQKPMPIVGDSPSHPNAPAFRLIV